jgi:hypothetical protein
MRDERQVRGDRQRSRGCCGCPRTRAKRHTGHQLEGAWRAAANKLAPFSGWSLHATEAPWLIIKNLDRDERSHRGRYTTISTTIYVRLFEEGGGRPRRIGQNGP